MHVHLAVVCRLVQYDISELISVQMECLDLKLITQLDILLKTNNIIQNDKKKRDEKVTNKHHTIVTALHNTEIITKTASTHNRLNRV